MKTPLNSTLLLVNGIILRRLDPSFNPHAMLPTFPNSVQVSLFYALPLGNLPQKIC